MNLIELPFAKLYYKAPIVYLVLNEGVNLDAPDIKQIIKSCEQLSDHKPYLLFSDARVFLSITAEGRKIASDPNESKLVIANAVLINNLSIKLVANFFATFNQPHFKFKVFTNRQKAVDWLLKFELTK